IREESSDQPSSRLERRLLRRRGLHLVEGTRARLANLEVDPTDLPHIGIRLQCFVLQQCPTRLDGDRSPPSAGHFEDHCREVHRAAMGLSIAPVPTKTMLPYYRPTQ